MIDRDLAELYRVETSYAFTEQGVAMLSTVLRSETAIRVSIRIMDAFVAMRRFMVTNAEVSNVFQQWSTINWKCSNISKKQTSA